MRTFHLVRFNHRYPDRSIVCDRCGEELSPNFYYNIYENGELSNEYPFHTRRCAREFIRKELAPSGFFDVIVVMDGSKDFFQEEETED